MGSADLVKKLKEFVLEEGAAVCGTTSVKDIKNEFDLPKEKIKNLNYAISIGFKLSDSVIEQIIDYPTKLYFHHYRMANMFLDQLALRVVAKIELKNFSALSIPASFMVDWKSQSSYLSHKKIANLCGLGWIGRNNLLVSPEFGSYLRFATILTDLKLPHSEPLDFGCGDCFLCLKKCPAGAIKEKPSDFDHIACYNKLDEFKKRNLVAQHICGICVKSCKPKA